MITAVYDSDSTRIWIHDNDSTNQIITIIQQPYFIIPFLFWLICYIYCQTVAAMITRRNQSHANITTTTEPVPFHKWYTIHNIHNFGAILLGTISIVLAEPYPIIVTSSSSSSLSLISSLLRQTKYNERIPILWSLSYFIIDIIDCCIRRDFIYALHGICCFVLGCMNYTVPVLQILKMNSKATYCELSNPFMHLAKRTRQPLHFILFAVVYTFCRILWIPIMYYQLISYEHHVHHPTTTPTTDSNDSIVIEINRIPWYHPISCILMAFYILNLYWYMKIINILLTGGGSKSSASGTSTKNHSDIKKSQ
jgi:hypothetical protein